MNQMRYNNWLFNYSNKINTLARIGRLRQHSSNRHKMENDAPFFTPIVYVMQCTVCKPEIVKTKFCNPDPNRVFTLTYCEQLPFINTKNQVK